MNAYAAHLERAAADHERDGHRGIARDMRALAWCAVSRSTLEHVLRRVTDWDETTLTATLDAADAEAKRGG